MSWRAASHYYTQTFQKRDHRRLPHNFVSSPPCRINLLGGVSTFTSFSSIICLSREAGSSASSSSVMRMIDCHLDFDQFGSWWLLSGLPARAGIWKYTKVDVFSPRHVLFTKRLSVDRPRVVPSSCSLIVVRHRHRSHVYLRLSIPRSYSPAGIGRPPHPLYCRSHQYSWLLLVGTRILSLLGSFVGLRDLCSSSCCRPNNEKKTLTRIHPSSITYRVHQRVRMPFKGHT
jgi:hypothetical protein